MNKKEVPSGFYLLPPNIARAIFHHSSGTENRSKNNEELIEKALDTTVSSGYVPTIRVSLTEPILCSQDRWRCSQDEPAKTPDSLNFETMKECKLCRGSCSIGHPPGKFS